MTQIKISALPPSTGVDTTNDVLPVVHSGTTEKVSPQSLVNAAFPLVPFTPVGTISSTTVLAAITELDTEKAAITSLPTEMTSNVANSGTSSTPQTISAATLATVSIPTLASIPSSYTGVFRIGSTVYAGSGSTPVELGTAGSGTTTDTLANLLTTTGTAGSLATASDQAAIVRMFGTVPGGDVFWPGNTGAGLLNFTNTAVATYINATGIGSGMMDFLIGSPFQPLLVWPKSTGWKWTKNGLDYLELEGYQNPVDQGFITNSGNTIVSYTPATNGSQIQFINPLAVTAVFATAAYGPLPSTPAGTGFAKPYACGEDMGVALATDKTSTIFINHNNSYMVQKNLPAGSAYSNFLIPQKWRPSGLLVIAYTLSTLNPTTKIAVLSNSGAANSGLWSGAESSWTEITYGSGLLNSTRVAISDNYVVIGDFFAPVTYTPSYPGYSIGAFSSVGFTVTDLGGLVGSIWGTPAGFYYTAPLGAGYGLFFTKNCISSVLVKTLTAHTGHSAYPMKNGMLFLESITTGYYVTETGYSLMPRSPTYNPNSGASWGGSSSKAFGNNYISVGTGTAPYYSNAFLSLPPIKNNSIQDESIITNDIYLEIKPNVTTLIVDVSISGLTSCFIGFPLPYHGQEVTICFTGNNPIGGVTMLLPTPSLTDTRVNNVISGNVQPFAVTANQTVNFIYSRSTYSTYGNWVRTQ